jgi:hypothetical protein
MPKKDDQAPLVEGLQDLLDLGAIRAAGSAKTSLEALEGAKVRMKLTGAKSNCVNSACSLRLACGRFKSSSTSRPSTGCIFNGGKTDGEGCPEFEVRKELGGGSEDAPENLDIGLRRGLRHNAHAPERTSYPGSEALFGPILGTIKGRRPPGGKGKGKAPIPNVPLPKKPDLMVRRHISNGRDINKKD